MMLKVGKLYICEEYFLMLYPDQRTAAAVAPRTAATSVNVAADLHRAAVAAASYWSNRFNKSVFYADKNIPLLVLNSKKNFYEVLAGDKKGWIIYKDWLKIREIEEYA